MTLPSAHQFDPQAEGAFGGIQTLLANHAVTVSEEPGGVRLSLSVNAELTNLDLGRLLLINAKFRDIDTTLRVSLPAKPYQQLQSLGIERIVWLDEE